MKIFSVIFASVKGILILIGLSITIYNVFKKSWAKSVKFFLYTVGALILITAFELILVELINN